MLKRNLRLVKRGSFAYVYKKGERKSNGAISLIYVKSKNLKVGFSVNNKVGKAVKRNLVKRRLRAVVRSIIPSLNPAQIVVSVRPEIVLSDYKEIECALIKLFTKAGLYNPPSQMQ